MPPPYVGPIIDVLKKPFEVIADAFAVKPHPIIQQRKTPELEGQGAVLAPSQSVQLAEISLVPGSYLVLARFNIEVAAFASGRTAAHARTQLRVGSYENVWNNIDFVLNYSPRSLVAAHMLGVKLKRTENAVIRVLTDPDGSELVANGIVLACVPLDRLVLLET